MDFMLLYEKYIKKNNLKNIFILLIAGLGIILAGNLFSPSAGAGKDPPPKKGFDISEQRLIEKKLKHSLSRISGVGEVEVICRIDDLGESVIAYDERYAINSDSNQQGIKSDSSSDSKTVLKKSNGDELPVILKELMPRVRGITVIAQGADDLYIKSMIYNAVKSALGVPPHRIEILPYR